MKLVVSAVALLAMMSGASAADLGRKAPVPMPEIVTAYNWGGGYVGVYAGGAIGKSKGTDIEGVDYGDPGSSFSLANRALMGGATLGYNFQFGQWVVGPEFEIGWLGLGDKRKWDDDSLLVTDYSGLYGTAALRGGYAFDRLLVYGKLGVTAARIANGGGDFDGADDVPFGLDDDDAGWGEKTRYGWLAGIGAEYAFAQNWSVKGEYSFTQFNDKTYNGSEGDTPFKFKDQLHTLKIGLNYKF